jgi:serine kinase of HPr protein (carbohydrate metabolism regulator)
MSPAIERVHATVVALAGRAALIRGPSGSGKSDLALRCLALPPLPGHTERPELVADDQVEITRAGDGLDARPPRAIAGKIEVRGVGILDLPYRPVARLALVVDLVAARDVPRFPLDEKTAEFLGVTLPVAQLAPFEPSTPVKLLLALSAAREPLTPP